jgi:hypothetical protein
MEWKVFRLRRGLADVVRLSHVIVVQNNECCICTGTRNSVVGSKNRLNNGERKCGRPL